MGEGEAGATNLLDMLNNVDVDKVGDVLKEFEKYEKILDKISGITMRLNRIGVLPAIIRVAGVKSGIKNIDAPLPQQSELSIEAKSPAHLLMYLELNKQTEAFITEMFKQMVIEGAKANIKTKEEKKAKK